MENNKVAVSSEVQTALQDALQRFDNNKAQIIELHTQDIPAWGGRYEPLNHLSLQDLVNALLYGTELNETPPTPEEEILQRYEEEMDRYTAALHDSLDEQQAYGFRRGIEFTLNKLGIQIEGIAKEERK